MILSDVMLVACILAAMLFDRLKLRIGAPNDAVRLVKRPPLVESGLEAKK